MVYGDKTVNHFLFGALEEIRTPDPLVRSHKVDTFTIFNTTASIYIHHTVIDISTLTG